MQDLNRSLAPITAISADGHANEIVHPLGVHDDVGTAVGLAGGEIDVAR